jgi:hypothetical protein
MEIDQQALKVAKKVSVSEFKPASLAPEKKTLTHPTECQMFLSSFAISPKTAVK